MKNLEAISNKKVLSKDEFPFEEVGACNNCKFYDANGGDSYCGNRDGVFEGEQVSSFSPYSLMSGLSVREKMIGCNQIYVNGFKDIDLLGLMPEESYLRKKFEKSELFEIPAAKYNSVDVKDLLEGRVESLSNPLYKGGQSEK